MMQKPGNTSVTYSNKRMDNQLVTHSRATLTILSRLHSTDEIVRALGLTPDRIVEKDTPVQGKGGNVHRYNVVEFESHVDAEAEPSAHVDNLLLRLSPAKETIRAFAEPARAPGGRGVPVRFSLYIESARQMFGIDMSAEQLRAIGECGAHLGVEVDTDCASVGG
jgi:Domain of unknown function (DUF4279)